jgi:dTDP-4-dehydrorhamnose reductase
MKILITGASGLLGSYLVKELDRKKIEFIAMSRQELDIVDEAKVRIVLNQYLPTHIINCAAYTNVAQAEVEKDLCYSINFNGVKNLVNSANELGIFFIHISTDFVFEGNNSDFVYETYSHRKPINYYGLTKMLGEDYVISQALKWAIIRTSWLFGKYSNNFVNKIIEKANSELEIHVTDQESGSPTYGLDLAAAIVRVIDKGVIGIYHITNEGITSRYNFAKKIILLLGLSVKINKQQVKSDSIVTRPSKVLLSGENNPVPIKMRKWTNALKEYLNSELD